MPVVPSRLLEPAWVGFAALLNERRGGEPPEFAPGRPWGCYRRRVSDRVVFGHVISALVHGSGYERIATPGCSDRTIRRRLAQWAGWGLAGLLHAAALRAYDQLIGLELADVAVDGCLTKAPCGGERAGPSPVDRRKGGLKRSLPPFDDGSVANTGNTRGQFGSIRIEVPDDHYVSSINVISRFHDHDRGWLHNDLVRSLYFGLKLKPEALGLGSDSVPRSLPPKQTSLPHQGLTRPPKQPESTTTNGECSSAVTPPLARGFASLRPAPRSIATDPTCTFWAAAFRPAPVPTARNAAVQSVSTCRQYDGIALRRRCDVHCRTCI